MRRLSVFLIIFGIFLQGCAQQQIKSTGQYQLQSMQHLNAQKNWNFDGRLAVVAEHESFSASLNWQHHPSGDIIELVGPMGFGRVLIDVTETRVVVNDGSSELVYLDSADQVFAKYFAVSIPVQAFRYWLLGLVEPNYDYKEIEQGFVQHQWQVKFRQMQKHGTEWLPRKIMFGKESTKIKLMIDQWKLL